MIVGQAIPDRQEQARDQIERAGAGLVPHLLYLGLPQRRKFLLAGLFPHRFEQQVLPHPLGTGRPNQLVAANDLAIVVGERIGAAPDRGPAGLPIDDWARVIAQDPQRAIERERLIALLRFEAQDLGFCAACLIAPDHGAIKDRDAFGIDALDTKIERARFARRLDPGLDQTEIFIEDRILQRDAQCENTIEPALNGRQLLLQPTAFALQLKSGEGLEFIERRRAQLAVGQKAEPCLEGSLA